MLGELQRAPRPRALSLTRSASCHWSYPSPWGRRIARDTRAGEMSWMSRSSAARILSTWRAYTAPARRRRRRVLAPELRSERFGEAHRGFDLHATDRDALDVD